MKRFILIIFFVLMALSFGIADVENQNDWYVIHKFFSDLNPIQRDWLNKIIAEQRITNREKEILTLIAQGLTNKEIGVRLFITETTVKTHTKSILKKIGVRNRIQLFNLLREKTEE